jgi:hypothetical protein
VELRGNLAQNARSRNLLAFSNGTVQTLVATDIAARGIHIDDVNLVIHADPPVEHNAYLHRSGRTARAGATGTVITLMTDDQAGDVRALTRSAGITPVTTRLGPGHPLLRQIAAGQRTFVAAPTAPNTAAPSHTRTDPPRRGRTGRRSVARRAATQPARHPPAQQAPGPRPGQLPSVVLPAPPLHGRAADLPVLARLASGWMMIERRRLAHRAR